MWKFLTVEGLPMLFRSYFGYADRSILERLSISSRVWSAISSLSQPRSSTTSTKISERGSTLLLLLTLIWSSEAIVIMEMETYFIPGLVLYTISNEDLRESLRSFIKNELQGEKINESSYSLRKTATPMPKICWNPSSMSIFALSLKTISSGSATQQRWQTIIAGIIETI